MEIMNIKSIVHWVPMLLWMGLIYYLSAQLAQASSELSSNVMHLLLQFAENIIEVDEAFFHHLVRKGAHLSAYFILGILTMFALGTSRFRGGFKVRSEEHTSELQSRFDLVCRLLLEK